MVRPLDVVMFGFNDWHQWSEEGFCSRGGAHARELSTNPRIGRMLVVSAPSSAAMRLVRRLRHDESKPRVRVGLGGIRGLSKAAPRVFTLDHTRLLPLEARFEGFYRLNGMLHDAALRRRLRAAVAELGMQNCVLWVADPLMTKHIGRLDETLSVFDSVDDWTAHPQKRHIRRAVLDGYRIANSEADVIFAVSEPLTRKLARTRDRVYLQPNGVDFELFGSDPETPADIISLPRPVFGYVGVMQERLDVDAIALLARQNPGSSVVMIGPVLTPSHFRTLRSTGNVHFLGPRDHCLIPAYLRSFDVCIMPHVSDALTRSMNPLKVYEYLAAGRPVVATSLVGFEDTEDLVVSAPDAAAFAASAAEAAARDDGLASARRAYAEQHSWSKRVNAMLSIIERAMP